VQATPRSKATWLPATRGETGRRLVSERAAGRHPALWPGLALAGCGAIGFGGKAIIVKLAYRYGVDPLTLIMLRRCR
jgi:hypothetical protein